MVDVLRKKSTQNFETTIARVENALRSAGLTVMLTKAIDEILIKQLNLPAYPRYTIILACGPEFAKAALDVSKDVGLLFPCSFAVYEDQGEIWIAHISIMKIAAEIGLAPREAMQPVITLTGTSIQKAWSFL